LVAAILGDERKWQGSRQRVTSVFANRVAGSRLEMSYGESIDGEETEQDENIREPWSKLAMG